MLDTLITSKTRIRLLVKFFVNAANKGHMRGLAEEFNESTNAIRKELNHLSEAGYLIKSSERNRVDYTANTSHPLFSSLQHIVRKYLGLDTIVTTVLERMGEVDRVVITGDYARGLDTGTIAVTVVGPALRAAYLEQLAPKLEALIGRRVVITLSVAEVHAQPQLVVYEKES
jgi:hypothetical protein